MLKNKYPASTFILIGGKSERFGSPKWRTLIREESVLDRIWKSCENFENRYVIGKTKPTDLDKPFICDKLKFEAPINGLYTALKYSKTDWLLLLACDLPLVDVNIFEYLWNFKTNDIDCIVPYSNHQYQVTCAFYHRRVLPIILSEIKANNYSLVKLLEKMNSAVIKFNDDIRFWNMNTTQDLKKINNFCT